MFIRIILSALAILILSVCLGQNTSVLYQDHKVKVTFKPINSQYGYVLEEYSGMYGGTVVKYNVEKKNLIIEEIDTVLIIDSMLFNGYDSYQEDSIQIILRYRVQEFGNTTVADSDIKYVINDSLSFGGSKLYPDDELHRALLPKTETPYNLKIYSGNELIGSFRVITSNDLEVKIVILASSYFEEIELNKLLPNEVEYAGRTLKLKYKPFEY